MLTVNESLELATPVASKKKNATDINLVGGALAYDGHKSPEASITVRPMATTSDRNVSQRQRVAYLESIVRQYVGDIDLNLESLKALSQTPETGQKHHTPMAQADDCDSSLSETSVGVNETCDILPVDNNIAHYSGEFSHWNFSQRIRKYMNTLPKEQTQDSVSSWKDFYRTDELQSPTAATTALSSLPPRPIANFLLRCFLKHAQTNYFYVEETWVEDKLDLCYAKPDVLSRGDVGVVSILFAILAIGTQYAYIESDRADNGNMGPDPNISSFTEDAVGVMFYQQASRLLPEVLTLGSLECVQACLLIAVYLLPIDAAGLSYSYLNIAINVSIQNGMHRRYSRDDLDTRVREIRNRVWWTTYTIERRISIFHGRPMSIRPVDVDADMPSEQSHICPWTTITVPCILATLRLNEFLRKLWNEIDLLKGAPKQKAIMRRLTSLHGDLIAWWSDLSTDLLLQEESSQPERYSLQLKLEYCLVRMFCGRCFIFSNDAAGTTPEQHSAISPSAASDITHPRSVLVRDCVKAAFEAIETCRHIHNTIGLARASYTEFSSCRAALLIITTQCLQTKCHTFRYALRDGLSMLKHMASGSRLAHVEASLVDRFEQVIARLDQAASMEKKGPSDYDKFKEWETEWRTDSVFASTDSPRAFQGVSPAKESASLNQIGPDKSDELGSSSEPQLYASGDVAFFPESDDWTTFFGADFLMQLDDGIRGNRRD
ncbi:hypothetical protein V2G26_004807 [Clonostachys chloroleuca]